MCVLRKRRKSSIVSEFAARCQDGCSVFWFYAESPEAIDRSFKDIAHVLDLERRGPKGSGEKHRFKDWLTLEHVAPWIAVFDNAYEGLDIRGMLPSTGGKVIITSRHENFKVDDEFETRQITPLSTLEAVELFLAIWASHRKPRVECPSVLQTTKSILEGLRAKPLSISLAASCVASMDFDSAQSHLRVLQDETTSDPDNGDGMV
jgi:hypothetical protein